jgi:hypothetical protein
MTEGISILFVYIFQLIEAFIGIPSRPLVFLKCGLLGHLYLLYGQLT